MLTLLCAAALAAPGLRFDGPQPALGQAQISGSTWMDPMAGQVGALGGARIGFGQELSGEVSVGVPWVGNGLVAEARLAGALLGKYDDPRLSLWVGGDLTRADSGGGAMLGWWLEAGLVAGAPLERVPTLRLYAGLVANGGPDEDPIELWFDPGVGASWRPRLRPHLTGLVSVEAWASTDLEQVEVGPLLTLGLQTTPFSSR